MSRFNGRETDFWATLNPARLEAMCRALNPPRDTQAQAAPAQGEQMSAREFFREVMSDSNA